MVVVTMTIKKTKNGKLLFFGKIIRNNDLKIHIQTSAEIEEFFKTLCPTTQTSQNWRPNAEITHKFYGNVDYADEIREFFHSFANEYGTNLYNGYGKPNVSFLRTVGIKDGKDFVVSNQYTQETLEKFLKDLRNFTVQLYKQYMRQVTITCTSYIEEVI